MKAKNALMMMGLGLGAVSAAAMIGGSMTGKSGVKSTVTRAAHKAADTLDKMM